MDTKALPLLLFILITLYGSVTPAVRNGCYSVDKRRRHFSITPGDYNPESMTPAVCAAKCGAFSYNYAALTFGKFCFCGATLPGTSAVADALCNTPCSGDNLQKCGDTDYVEVYTSSPPIVGLELTSSPSLTNGISVVNVGDVVTFGASYKSAGTGLTFQLDYGDGAGRTGKNDTDMWAQRFYMPGQYQITLSGNDAIDSLVEKQATTTVMVEADAQNVSLVCPEYMASYEEGVCVLVVLGGTNLQITHSVDGTPYTSFYIADPPMYTAGPDIPRTGTGSVVGDTSGNIVVMPRSEFQHDGKLIGFEYYAETAGTVTFYVFSPSCVDYCFDTNQCNPTCANLHERTCAGGYLYCTASENCYDGSSCAALPVRYDGTQRTALTEVFSISYSIPSTGLGYYALDLTTNDVSVGPGYIIGYKKGTGNLQAISSTTALSDLSTTNIATPGSASVLSKRHLLKAISSAGSSAIMPYTFTTTGVKTISVTVTNTRTSSSQTVTDIVNVIEGIDKADIDLPLYAEKAVDISFKLLPHTGTNVTYWWDFGDLTEVNTTSSPYLKQYANTGEYNVSVVAFNPLSSKTGYKTIVIEESITGLNLIGQYAVVNEMTSIQLAMTSGSHYTCQWTKDGTSIGSTTDSVTPPNSLYNMTFTLDGTYSIGVTCSNNLNSMTSTVQITAQRRITGLQLINTGALLNQQYKVKFRWTDGSSPQFRLEFNGVTKTLTVNTFLREVETIDYFPAETTSTSYPLNITAFNLVSNEQIITTFGIESEIVNPVPTISDNVPLGYKAVAKGDSLTFGVDATSGTNVNIKWEHTDPSSVYSVIADITIPTWTTTQSRSIAFTDLGYHNVTLTVQNAYSVHVYNYRILAIAPVENIAMNTIGPTMFVPPADIVLTFIQSPATIPPNEAVMELDMGDGTAVTTNDFVLSNPYPYQYREDGTFTITANISNAVSHQVVTQTVDIVEAIHGLEIEPESAAKGDPVDIKVKLYRGGTGSKLQLMWDLGTGVYGAYQDRTGISPNGVDTKTSTFNTVRDYVIRVTAKSALETKEVTHTLKCQEKVTTNFTLMTTHPRHYDATGGDTLQYTLTYNGVIPTDATIEFDYGDGNQFSQPLPITSSGASHTFTYIYATDGDYVTSFRIYNLVSDVSVQVSSGTYRDFVGLSAQVKWKPFLPLNGPDLDGYGTNKDSFPQDRPVRFLMSRSQGTFVYYDIIATASGSVIVCNKTNPDVFELDFSNAEMGPYTVQITARNPLFSQTITKNIQIMVPVEGITIDDGGLRTNAYNLKKFNMTFSYVSGDACVVVDFGDGRGLKSYGDAARCGSDPRSSGADYQTTPITNNTLEIDHTYVAMGTFEVQAEGFNDFSTATAKFIVVISGVDCSQPRLGIKNHKEKFNSPQKSKRSVRLNIVGITDINCAHTLNNQKLWRLYEIDPYNGTEMAEINITSESSSRKAELSLAPLFLNFGLYKAVYKMTMTPGEFQSNETFSASVDHFFEIVETELVVIIFPGGTTKLVRGYGESVTIKPETYSYDPDLELGLPNPQNFDNFTWYCREENEMFSDPMPAPHSPYTDADLAANPADNGGCFRQGPGQIDTLSGSLTFTTSNMKVNSTYVFVVEGRKGNRMSRATAELLILQGTPPQPEISCGPNLCISDPEGMRIRPSARLSLSMNCPVGCTGDTTYEWFVRQANHQYTFKDVIPLSKYVDGVKSSKIAISTTLFDLDKTVLKYQVEVRATRGDGQWGMAQMILILNTPPSGGNCTVSPLVGVALKDNFTVVCNDWEDVNGISEYRIYTTVSGYDMERQVVFGDEPSYTVQLQVGPDYDDYNTTVYVRITDSLGAASVAKAGVVQVKPMSGADVEAKLNAMTNELKDDLDMEIAKADVTKLNEIGAMYASLMNARSKNTSSEFAGIDVASTHASTGMGVNYNDRQGAFDTSKTTYEKEKEYQLQRDTSVQIVSQITEALNSVTVGSMSACALTSSTLAQLTQYPENCARSCQDSVGNVIDNMATTISQLADEGSTLEEVTTAATGMISALSNIMEASNVNYDYPSETDKKDVEDVAYYNTDWETEEEAIPHDVTRYDQGTDELLKITNKDFQAETGRKTQNVYGKALQSLRGTLMKMKVDGEKATTITTPSIAISFEKNQADQIAKNIELGSASNVELPDWCSLQTGNCNPNASVMIQASYTVFYPNAYTKNAVDLSPYSGALNIDFFSDDGNPITISGTRKPIELTIALDRKMPKPTTESIVPFIPDRDSEHFFYQTTTITTTRASIQQTFRDMDTSKQFLVLIRLGGIENIIEDFDFVCMIPHKMKYAGQFGATTSYPDPYTCFVDSDLVNGYKGEVSFAIRQMQQAEQDRYISKSHVPKSFPKGSGDFSTNYTSHFVSANCKYFDESKQDWEWTGCKVGDKTDDTSVHCECTHLTTFAGGWVVVPNTIDWNFVFSNMDFYKNPTLYITEMVIIVFYIVGVIWARRQDKRDVEKLGLTPLADNNKTDHYYYEIVVVTGMRRNAGSDSKVSFILSGDADETEVRELRDNKRKILRRGAVDGFLMAVPRPLGQLTYLHIWHDNSGKGKFASWYMRSMVVRDVQTNEKYIFIANKWFAVEEDDGMIDRIIPVAGVEQMTEFTHLFSEKTTKSLSDGHLWFSVVARPPQSRFTRVQRVSCCLCLLFMTMVTNAMFYERGENGDASKTFTFGPFALTPEQVYIGVISNLIVFPINFLVIFIFRKSRPRKKRPSRVMEALKDTNKPAASVSDINPTLTSSQAGCPTPQILDRHRPETSLSRGQTSLSIVDVAHANGEKKKKKKCDLPWWFVIVGWILLWLATLTSAAFVTFYGVQFQDLKCKKWITSMLISFFASVFVTQPVKVFLTAIFFSLVIKNPGGEEDEEADDEENAKIAADEELLHDQEDVFSFTKPRKAAYRPPDPNLLKKAREVRMKEIKMWAIVREIVFYAFFLWILMVISYRNRSYHSYLYKQSLEKVFIVTNDTKHHFMKIKNQNDFWVWAKSGLIEGLRASTWYNGWQPIFMRGYINDKQSRIMGYATMRQLRIKTGTCKIPKDMETVVTECNDQYSVGDQDENSYSVGWQELTGNSSVDDTREEYMYSTAKSLDGYPYIGQMAMYSGGGYVVRLRGNATVLYDMLDQLQSEKWIDKYTRAIFVEFTVYNSGINLFGISTLLLEVRPSQGFFPSYRFEPVMLLPYMDSVMLFQIACEIIYLIFTLFFTFQLIRGLYRQKKDFFKEFWNGADVGICAMSITAIVIYFYRLFETNRLTERFKISHGNEYMKFQYVGYWSEVFSYIIGWLVFFASLKFLKLLRFNKRMSLLASTLRTSAKDLMHFSIIFNIIFLAFIQLFYLVYAANITSFKTFVSSCESGIVMMMGKFDIYEMIAVEPIMTQIFIFGYVVTITFITVNMFLSILNETFSSVRSDIAKQCNDYEIVDFMMNRFKMWTGLGTPDRSALKPEVVTGGNTGERNIEEFPERIDQLLHSVSYMYMEKDRLDTLLEMNSEKARLKALGMGMSAHPPPARSQAYRRPQDKMTMVHTNY